MESKMFKLYQQGPDNRSTYAECFGPNSGPGRKIAEASRLVGLIDAIEGIGHDNFAVYGPGGRCEAGGRCEFFTRPTVAAEVARRIKEANAQ
jgi:hypothetical protein